MISILSELGNFNQSDLEAVFQVRKTSLKRDKYTF